MPPLKFTQHHQSHAGSAFYCSPYQEAAVLCIDGVGEWATTSLWHGCNSKDGPALLPLWQIDFPHSLGLLYSAVTYFCGFAVNSGEYKLMGLAPFGQPRYAGIIEDRLIDIKPDGTFRLNLEYFDFCIGNKMTSAKFDALFEANRRPPESEIRQLDMDLAASIQKVTEKVIIRLAETARRETGSANLCLAGGVALNCVANGKLRRAGIFENIWAQPAAGDAGGAVGAAFCAMHALNPELASKSKPAGEDNPDLMSNCLLGPEYSTQAIQATLDKHGAVFQKLAPKELLATTAHYLSTGAVVGWFQGAMEFGPRALGSRSILGDPGNPGIQKTMNLQIKFRESFRPFAPIVLEEDVSLYFETDKPSPYMMFVENINQRQRVSQPESHSGLDRVNEIRSTIPAVTHLDYSARIQTVSASSNELLHQLLQKFKSITGSSVLINTSFNVRGEPIVASPEDAYRCFTATNMDMLVIGDCILMKKDQPGQTTDHQLITEADSQQAMEAESQTPRSSRLAADVASKSQNPRELVKFSRTIAGIIGVIFGLLLPALNLIPWSPLIWIPVVLLFLCGELYPLALRRLFYGWFWIGHQLSRITSPILLGIVFFVVLTPIGILRRLRATQRFEKHWRNNEISYRKPSITQINLDEPF